MHTNLVLINTYLRYFLWAKIPSFTADKTMYSISDFIFFYKKIHEMEGSCANLMSLCAAQ